MKHYSIKTYYEVLLLLVLLNSVTLKHYNQKYEFLTDKNKYTRYINLYSFVFSNRGVEISF